jgi:hypothetical protein
MVPRQKKGTGAEVYCHGTRRKLTLSPGHYATVFQAEVHPVKGYAAENLVTDYKNTNICILSDSQTAIKALGKYQITSKLVSHNTGQT